MDFKVEGPCNNEKYWLADKENFSILDTLECLKQYRVDLGQSLLIVSALKLFFSFVSATPLWLTDNIRGAWPSGLRCRD